MSEQTVAAQLVALSGETTSPAYITDAGVFTEYVAADDRYLFVYREHGIEAGVVEVTALEDLDRSDWAVRAFALAGQYDRDAYAEVVNVPVDLLVTATPLRETDFPLSVVKVLAVDPDYQSRGIGSELSAIVAAELFKHPPVVTMLWLRDNPANVKIAESYSEFILARFDDYFPDDWQCPDCGLENPCTCSVAMYGWFADGRGLDEEERPVVAEASD
ncbi:GNAT family N-acetyltransferase [Halorarius litoreus]|uniref:GNAT family N-acetyltransferase n=1 Tax=Halorarius litoreus TaxID=2962676 RepID=UPI0020CBF81F|nr:hypothetical protein [Halorarius litoreus]